MADARERGDRDDGPLALARRLRESFDRSFAEPIAAPEPRVALLALDVAKERCAVLLSEVGAIARRPPLRRLPSAHAELLGVAALGGEIVAVYGLAELLGWGRTRSDGGWLVRLGAEPQLALAFDAFAGLWEIAPGDLCRADGGELVGATASIGGAVQSVVSLVAVRERIAKKRTGGS